MRSTRQWLREALSLPEGSTPFPWQEALLTRFTNGMIDRSLDIPTGLGKTAVMAVWLVARAQGASLPRRLVYVVDRRAVVDQATEVAKGLRDFVDRNSELQQGLGLENRSLPISTLRGQYVDNKEWLEDPAAPAIIVGTVDMIGSRLLFEGYGTSRKMRPYHAGLVGADTLIVLDEAHLVPPFEKLIESVADGHEMFGPRDEELSKLLPLFKLLSLSATGRTSAGKSFSLQEADLKHPIVRRRLDAAKSLTVCPLDGATKLEDALARRRIEPTRMAEEAKDGAELAVEQSRVAAAVVQALRHAEVRAHANMIRVQREPFEANGDRVEAFAQGTRFSKERLWHVEVSFNAPVAGPLVIGDGRFLGLGVMAPVRQSQGIHAFSIESGLAAAPRASEIAHALRRAVMARVQETVGSRVRLSAFFTGHELDGSPVQTEHRGHLTFVFDPESTRLLIIAPHVIDRRVPTLEEAACLVSLDVALVEFRELRAGSSGRFVLTGGSIDADVDPLFAASRIWDSVTPYHVTRHTKDIGAGEALAADLCAECRRRSLPEPRVSPRDPHGVPGVGLIGAARLTFEIAVRGPIVLGRNRHFGGGLFRGVQGRQA